MAEKKIVHIHKFKRLRYKSGNEIFFCTLPDCSQKINPALALGKRSICWRCSEPFIMTEYSLRLAKPHCDACHKTKNIDITLEEIGIVDAAQSICTPGELSLQERLNQTIQANQKQEEEEL